LLEYKDIFTTEPRTIERSAQCFGNLFLKINELGGSDYAVAKAVEDLMRNDFWGIRGNLKRTEREGAERFLDGHLEELGNIDWTEELSEEQHRDSIKNIYGCILEDLLSYRQIISTMIEKEVFAEQEPRRNFLGWVVKRERVIHDIVSQEFTYEKLKDVLRTKLRRAQVKLDGDVPVELDALSGVSSDIATYNRILMLVFMERDWLKRYLKS